MPTYSYACTSCDHRFDIQQSFSDSALTVCPECEGKLRKLFNSVGIVFKGSGFYRTDSRSGSSASNGSSASDGGGSSTTSNGTSASTKSESNGSSSTSKSESPGSTKTAPATSGSAA